MKGGKENPQQREQQERAETRTREPIKLNLQQIDLSQRKQ